MVSIAFRQEILELPLAHLFQLKDIDPRIKKILALRIQNIRTGKTKLLSLRYDNTPAQ